jgi:hypothetical protein
VRTCGAPDRACSIDPITEASARSLEAAELQRDRDEGIDAVIAAVQSANADTDPTRAARSSSTSWGALRRRLHDDQ